MDIKQKIVEGLKKAVDENLIENTINNIHFYVGNGHCEPGIYLYEESDKYYYLEVGDRGGINAEIKTPNLEYILYKIYSNVTFNIAIKFAMENAQKGKDWRRILFAKQLEMLRCIGEIYYKKRFEEIEMILSKDPYEDEL